MGRLQLDDPQAPETRLIQTNPSRPLPPASPVLSDSTSQVRNLSTVLSPALPFGGPILPILGLERTFLFTSSRGGVRLLLSQPGSQQPPSSPAASTPAQSSREGQRHLRIGKGDPAPPCGSLCWLPAPAVTRDGLWALGLPCKAQPVSPASPGPEHPTLPHSRLLSASLTAPRSSPAGLGARCHLRRGSPVSFVHLEDGSVPSKRSSDVTVSGKEVPCPPVLCSQNQFSMAPL